MDEQAGLLDGRNVLRAEDPLLDKPDKQAETRRLYNARKAIYHRVSDVSVRSPKLGEVLDKVVKSI